MQEDAGSVEYNNFLKVISRVVGDDAYKRDTEERLYKCFLALDKDKKGYLTKEELVHYMTLENVGEPLTTEELEEMVSMRQRVESELICRLPPVPTRKMVEFIMKNSCTICSWTLDE